MKKTIRKKTKSLNPVDLCLTPTQHKAYLFIAKRHAAGQITKRSDIQAALNNVDRAWICRIIDVLIDRGLVERYKQRYYKLAT